MTSPHGPGPDQRLEGSLPEHLTAADVDELRSAFEAQFGSQAAAVMFGTFQGSLPDEVVEGLVEVLGSMRGSMPADAAPPDLDEVRVAHEQMRRLVGDRRPPDEG